MAANASKTSYVAALLVAILGVVLCAVAIATPEWTKTDNIKIGLWSLTSGNVTYTWTDTGKYEENFFYSSWFMSVRALMMAGIIIGGLGILFNLYVVFKREPSPTEGRVLLGFYMLSFALIIIAGAVYTILIPQGVNAQGIIVGAKKEIVKYIYLGGYGYSLWFCWVSSGVVLPAAGMAFEGSNQRVKWQKKADVMEGRRTI